MSDISITLHPDLADIGAAAWDACANPGCGVPDDPFTTFRFLRGLEVSGSVGPGTGWQPFYVEARAGDTTLGFAPLYAKSHSQGEYIFDHGFAEAFERAGGSYYPKLQIAVPFTPATGRRLLIADGVSDDTATAVAQGLLVGAAQVAQNNDMSSVHMTFCTGDECALAEKTGYLPRTTQQFHWENAGYANFDGFLAALSSRKRKNIRRERAQAQGFGGDIVTLTGDQIEAQHMRAMWGFYQDTGARKWGTPYLSRAFFDYALDHLRDDMLLSLAWRDGEWVAGAMNFIGRDTLYGRYWGCSDMIPAMHFELCYYQAMDWAIAKGLSRVEAGAQGQHKIARGYVPQVIHSAHWFADAGFSDAVADYLQAEARGVGDDMEYLRSFAPFKKDGKT